MRQIQIQIQMRTPVVLRRGLRRASPRNTSKQDQGRSE